MIVEKIPQPNNNQEIINFILKQMEMKSSVFENIDWASLPEEYFNFFEKLKDNKLDERELLNFLNSSSVVFARQLKEYAESRNSEITEKIIEKHPVAAARRFFRDWLQARSNERKLKK